MMKPLKRFFVSSLSDSGNRFDHAKTILLDSHQTHYVKHVLRMKKGSLCLFFDGSGNEFVGRLERFMGNQRCEAALLERRTGERSDARIQISCAQAIPQHRKMDVIVEKAAELGVFELIPLVTERTVVQISKEREQKVIDRWNRIARQTLQQSRVANAPAILPLTTFVELCQQFSRFDQVYLFHPSEDAQPAQEIVRTKSSRVARPTDEKSVLKPRRLLLIIGPEGGFSDLELKGAKQNKAHVVRLHSGIMKTDTAFVAATSFFKASYEG